MALIIGFRSADGGYTAVSAANPLPVTGGGGGGGGGDVNLTQIAGTAVATGAGNTDAGTQRVVIATNQATLPVSGPLTDTQLRATAVPVSGPLTDTQLRATAVPIVSAGDVANDAADSGNPVKTGGKATTAGLAAVAANDRVDQAMTTRGAAHVVFQDPTTGAALNPLDAASVRSTAPTAVTATIANGASLSAGVAVNGKLAGFAAPSGWTAASLTFQGSCDGGTTYVNIYDLDSGGSPVERSLATALLGTASRFFPLDQNDWRAFTHIKVRSGPASAAVNQGAQRDIVLAVAGG